MKTSALPRRPSAGQWPDGANDTPTKPITCCPDCGGQSSNSHTCPRPKTRSQR